MKLHRWNGERWWVDDRGVLSRLLRWVAWFGGWEAHSTGSWTLRQRLGLLTPVSLLGHRVTIFSWGVDVRMRGGSWTYIRPQGQRRRALYFQRGGETLVYAIGTPHEVKHAAKVAQAEHDAMLARIRGETEAASV